MSKGNIDTIASIIKIIKNDCKIPYIKPPNSLNCFIIGNSEILSDTKLTNINIILANIYTIIKDKIFIIVEDMFFVTSVAISFCIVVLVFSIVLSI